MDTAHDDVADKKETLTPDESLPPFVAYQVGEESRENAPQSSGAAGEHYRHGRVEAETRRISDEVTREAQQRLHAAQEAREARGKVGVAGGASAMAPTLASESRLPAPKLLQRLLVPLDGSLPGERVLPYVAEFARLLDASLLLAHVTPTEQAPLLGRVLRVTDSERLVAQQAFAPEALPYLRQKQQCLDAPGRTIDAVHITAPTVAEGLLQLIAAHNIDLVFLALRKHSESDLEQVGRVADSLIRAGSTPALVIPPKADAGVHPFKIRHVLVPLDGSGLAEMALVPLLGLLAQMRPETSEPLDVTLLGVADDFTLQPDYQAYLDALRDTLEQLPECARARLHPQVVVGSPPGAIVGAVEHGIYREMELDAAGEPSALPVDMLIMTTHGRGGLTRWLFGSVADYVIPRVHVPVLVTRPGSLVKM